MRRQRRLANGQLAFRQGHVRGLPTRSEGEVKGGALLAVWLGALSGALVSDAHGLFACIAVAPFVVVGVWANRAR